jgi:hypothetical protein
MQLVTLSQDARLLAGAAEHIDAAFRGTADGREATVY